MKVGAKHVVAVFLISVFLLGIAQPFVPVTEGQQDSLVVDQAYWLRLANNAWNYFQPGRGGVDSTTGLHSASLWYPFFTDWDLGTYIQAIIDANQLDILSKSGTWGADARFNKILTFLQTRQLTSNGLPYAWYQSADGNPNTDDTQNAADAGALLVALNNLRVFRPDLAGTVNYIVYNRTNYAPLEQAVDSLTNSKKLYDYYAASGFAGFWPSRFSTLPGSILNNIVSAPTVSTYGVALPISELSCEPLLLSVFSLAPNAKLNGLADLVYLAHEARYSATGKFVAFSEGNTESNAGYVYEWVVKEDGSTWSIDDWQGTHMEIVPIIYFKAAVGLLAMHNTPFTKNMTSYVESKLPNPTNGYSGGIDENGRVLTTDVGNDNGIIIAAALYTIDNPPSPTPSPTPTPTSTPTSTPTPTPIPKMSLIIDSTAGGTINPSANTYYYNVGYQVTISASANSGYSFSYWLLNDGSKIFTSTTTLTLTTSMTALAVFAANPVHTPTPAPGATPTPTATPEPTPIPIATPTPNPTPTSSSASGSATPSPSSSVSLPGAVSLLVVLIIAVIVAVGCALFVLLVIGFRRKNLSKPLALTQLPMRAFRILLF